MKREPLLVPKQRTPDQVMMDLADKAEPILRPVIVYGEAATVGLAGNVGDAVAGAPCSWTRTPRRQRLSAPTWWL